jgi:hypothetical protein
MFLGLCALAALVLVPLTGGSLRRIADLRLRWLPLAGAALAVQILVISVLTSLPHEVAVVGHIASYLMLGVVVWANRHVPGMVLIGVGAGANALAITVNDGELPASSWALRHAEIHARSGFNNSGAIAHPHLAWLGDVMVTPSFLPLRNMVSIGDLVLLLGTVVLVLRVGRRSAPAADQSSSTRNIREPVGAIA